MLRRIESLGDRLLVRLVPKVTASAAPAECPGICTGPIYYERCGGRHSRCCCYAASVQATICMRCLYRP
jgi:hypothetical protein